MQNTLVSRPVSTTTAASHSAATCKWATPTLLLGAPFWFEAEHAQWACVRDIEPRILDTTEHCVSCARWEPRLD